ncbi:MAG TPA: hypothetical protein VGM88_21090 [Kofleriaceae bacterium]|jgi:hypothetical protein
MTDEDEVARLGAELPPLDVDSQSAQMIARRARADLGKRPKPWRLVEGIAIAVIVLGYLVYALLHYLLAFS